MHFDDIKIKYYGFSPTEFSKAFIDNIIYEVFEEAPYGSTITATFSKVDKHYKGILRITSAAGPFFAVTLGDQLHEVAKTLEVQIRLRLEKWKSKRFRAAASRARDARSTTAWKAQQKCA